MLYEPDHPAFVEIIEGTYDTLPTTRTFQSMSPSLVRNIRWKVRNLLSLGNGVIRTNYI